MIFQILDWDIQGITEMGAKTELNKTCGKDFTVEKLLNDGFNAVFIASGGWDSRIARGKLSETQKNYSRSESKRCLQCGFICYNSIINIHNFC
ncbi:MAG: hypothetical protein HQK76_12335 [Desulfobacterales bacterium]|nr:hypothetical protein [Desulfobacterales bacterium]